jgi:hypothetical protein
LLADYGPTLGRPRVDTLKGARRRNLKELRLQWRGKPWRFLFAFDRERAAVVLTGGCKAGDRRFYERHLRTAEARFAQHETSLSEVAVSRRRKMRT